MSFQNDLKFGESYQNKLIQCLKPDKYKMMTGYFKEYDLIIYTDDSTPIYYEVKADRYTHKTGNLCIEFECNKKPSGISTTTANIYSYFVITPNNGFELYNIPVEYIRNIIAENKFKFIKNGGDNYLSKFYLFDIKLFSKYKF